MKIFRKVVLYAAGFFALINLAGLIMTMAALRWSAVPWAILRLAIWVGICLYLIYLDRRSAPPPAGA